MPSPASPHLPFINSNNSNSSSAPARIKVIQPSNFNHPPIKLASNNTSRFPSCSSQSKINQNLNSKPIRASQIHRSPNINNSLPPTRPSTTSARSNLAHPTITAKVRPSACLANPHLGPPLPFASISAPRPGHVRTRSSVSTGPTKPTRLSPHLPPPHPPRLRPDTPSDLSSSNRLASDELSSASLSPPPPLPPQLAPALAIRRTSHPGPVASPHSPTNSLAVDWPRPPGSTAPSSPPSLIDGSADGPESCAHDEARVHRKVLDLEISNASLLAINAALERTKAKQAAEIRALRARLAEPRAPSSEPGSSSDGEPEDDGGLGTLVAEDAAFGEAVRLLEGLMAGASRALAQRGEPTGGKKVLSSVEVEQMRLEGLGSPSGDQDTTAGVEETTRHMTVRASNLPFPSSPDSNPHDQTPHQLPFQQHHHPSSTPLANNLNPRAGSRPASPSVRTLAGLFDSSSH